MNALDLGPLLAAIEANREASTIAARGDGPWPDAVNVAWVAAVAFWRERGVERRGRRLRPAEA